MCVLVFCLFVVVFCCINSTLHRDFNILWSQKPMSLTWSEIQKTDFLATGAYFCKSVLFCRNRCEWSKEYENRNTFLFDNDLNINVENPLYREYRDGASWPVSFSHLLFFFA